MTDRFSSSSLLPARSIRAGLAVALVLSSPLAAETAPPARPAVDGRITGWALERDDTPLAGQTVELALVTPRGDGEGRQTVSTTTTSATGYFRFDDVPEGTFRLRVMQDGREVATSERLTVTSETPEIVDIVVGPPPDVARSLTDLGSRVSPGTRLMVIDETGRDVTGRLLEITASTLVLEDGQTRHQVPLRGVLRVARHGDALWNGLAIGAALGAGAGAGLGAAYCADSIGRNCLSGQAQAQFAAFYAVTGAGIGLLVDWLRPSRELLYRARPSRARTRRSIDVAPVLARNRKGVVLSVGW